MAILRNAKTVGLSTQINTTVTTHNVDLLPEMVRFVKEVGAVQWSVFFLVPMGRGQELSMISPERHERVFEWLHDLALTGDFDIKATAAPMYRRVAMQRGDGRPVGGAGFAFHDGLNRPVQGVNDGRGFLFVSHLGEITPSGFLPLTAGNVRTDDVVDIYRNHPLFRSLRDPDQLTGKCGACEFRAVCGGQRGRAYAVTGDPLASDPACAYIPGRMGRSSCPPRGSQVWLDGLNRRFPPADEHAPAVATLSPRPSAASAQMWPNPRDLPVKNQVRDMRELLEQSRGRAGRYSACEALIS